MRLADAARLFSGGLLALTLFGTALEAQGHGPVYGLSTPTLGRGGWSLDIATMGRLRDSDRTAMVRPMLSFGVTEDLQVSASIPVPLASDASFPSARAFTRMPTSRDVEVMVGWRLQRRGTGIGTRQETTAWLATDVPTDRTRGGLETAPSLLAAIVTGYASRSTYIWLGAAREQSFRSGQGDHQEGNVTMASLVAGYRPPAFRGDYPEADWRGFVELIAESVGRHQKDGNAIEDSGGRQLYAALTVLGLYGSWGLAGGPAFPLYQSLNGSQPNEGVRFAFNLTFWF